MSAEQPIESADALSPFSDGTLIEDRFKIVGEVGRGGMSTVYEALHTITGKRLAIKVISEKLSADAAYHQRFLREAKLMAQMKHPAIAAVHAVGNYHGRLYIVMDFIEGTSLLDELSKGAMPEARACQIAIQVCEALAHAHAKGIIHRDLKPGNIMLERTESGDQIKLVDFGIAGWLDRDDTGRITQTGEVFGSPYFMSPEQAQGMRLDGRSDIYSLGCIMYQMLSGELPFSGGSMYEVLAKQMQSDPPPLKNVSSSWQKVVQAALAKNPDDRYQSATALREDLAKTAAGAPVKPRKPQTLRKGKLPTPIAICAALLFIAAAGVAIIQLALQIKIDRESLQAVVPVLSPEERDPAQVEDISGEIEAKSMLFVGRDKEATLPEHQRALEVMKSRTQLKNHDPEKGRRIDAAVDLLRKAIASKQGSTAERALMLHRLAVWDAILCHRGRDRTRQLAMYEEAMDSLKHAEALYNEVKPGFSTSYRKYHTLAFIN